MEIKALNQELQMNNEELENMITELLEREEYACTGNGCVGNVCGVV